MKNLLTNTWTTIRSGFILLLALQSMIGMAQTSDELQQVTSEFIESLAPDQLDIIQYKFEESLRTTWTNLPVGMEKRPGVKFGDLSEASRIKFHQILTTLLSSQGYLKVTSIMNLDDILNEVYETAFNRNNISEGALRRIKKLDWDYGNYFVSIWNSPHSEEPWGLKFEGHHISLNLSLIGDEYAVTPLFLGTDPAEVRTTKYAGLRVLSKEEDYGMRLINSLNAAQKATATISTDVPRDIITNPSNKERISSYYGIKATELTKEQQGILKQLLKEYIHNLEHDKSVKMLESIKKSGIEEIYFAWIGSYERYKPHYYILNGPDFLIEYDNVGFQNDGNHIHTIWRVKNNDFGEDLLKEHYKQHKH